MDEIERRVAKRLSKQRLGVSKEVDIDQVKEFQETKRIFDKCHSLEKKNCL